MTFYYTVFFHSYKLKEFCCQKGKESFILQGQKLSRTETEFALSRNTILKSGAGVPRLASLLSCRSRESGCFRAARPPSSAQPQRPASAPYCAHTGAPSASTAAARVPFDTGSTLGLQRSTTPSLSHECLYPRGLHASGLRVSALTRGRRGHYGAGAPFHAQGSFCLWGISVSQSVNIANNLQRWGPWRVEPWGRDPSLGRG